MSVLDEIDDLASIEQGEIDRRIYPDTEEGNARSRGRRDRS